MRWPRWRRPEPEPVPDHSRDERGRLYDGDTVRPDGWARWADLLPVRPVDPLTGDTAMLPVVTPAMRMRGEGGGWR